MRLGIYINQPCEYDGHAYWFHYISVVDFFVAISDQFDHISLCVPVRKIPNGQGSGTPLSFDPTRFSILWFPYYRGERQLIKKLPRVLVGAIVQGMRITKEVDVTGFTGPSLVSTIMGWISYLRRRPTFLLVRSDHHQILSCQYPRGLQRNFFLKGVEFYQLFANSLLRRGITILTVGDELAKKYSRYPGPVLPLYPSLDERFFLSSLTNRDYRPKQLCTLLFVGRLSKEKGLADLLRAVQILRNEKHLNVCLNIIGEGEDESFLRNLSEQLGISGDVRFRGHFPHDERLLTEYLSADLFILPSYTEGMPIAILEAMGTGLPVVATTVGSIPLIMQDGVSGIFAQPGQVNSLVESITKVVTDTTLRHRIAHAAHPIAAKCRFSIEGPKFVNILRGMVQKDSSDWN